MTKSPDKKRPSIFDDGSAQKRGAIAGRNIYIDDKGQTIMYISRRERCEELQSLSQSYRTWYCSSDVTDEPNK